MSKRGVGAQKPFKMLTPNLAGGSDPSRGESGNPVIKRKTFEQQYLIDLPGRGQRVQSKRGTGNQAGVMLETTGGIPVAASGTVTVSTNTFAGPTFVFLGKYTVVSDEDFVVGGSTGATATNLTAAIDALPGFSASVVGSDITVTGPTGPVGNITLFRTGGASPANFSLSPSGGTMSGAEPSIGPPTLT